MKPIVYFSREITPEKVLELYRVLGKELPGKIAVKVHSGEEGNQNFLHPEFWKSVVDAVNGTVVECNTAYEGARNLTEQHRRLLRKHGWSEVFDVDILDAEGPDLELPIPNGSVLKKDIVGKDIENYDSMLVLSHFKGHPMGGYGGALKQLSIGCASTAGKVLDPLRRHDDRPEPVRGQPSGAGRVPCGHGGRGKRRCGLFPRQHGVRERDEKPLRGLRLLRRGGGPLHEGHRHSRLARSGRGRSGVHRSHLCRDGRPRPKAISSSAWSRSTASTRSNAPPLSASAAASMSSSNCKNNSPCFWRN